MKREHSIVLMEIIKSAYPYWSRNSTKEELLMYQSLIESTFENCNLQIMEKSIRNLIKYCDFAPNISQINKEYERLELSLFDNIEPNSKMTFKSTKRMILKMKTNIKYFLSNVPATEIDDVVADWFGFLKSYKFSDVVETYKLVIKSGDTNLSLSEFLETLRVVSNRNSIAISNEKLELSLPMKKIRKEKAKEFLINIKKDLSKSVDRPIYWRV